MKRVPGTFCWEPALWVLCANGAWHFFLERLQATTFGIRTVIKTCIVFVVGLILGVGAMTAYQWRQGSSGQPVSTADPGGRESGTSGSPALSSSSNSPGAVVALGSIDPHGGIVNVASPLVGHRVQKVNVAEGLLVNKGDLLIQLDASVDELELQLVETQLAEARQRQEAEIELAEQALSAAELAVRQIRESRELDLAVQNAKIGVLAAKSKQVATDLERLRKLRQLSDPLVADQQVEQQSVLLDVSRSEQQAGEVGVKKLQQSLDFQLQNAEAEQQAASRALRLAESAGHPYAGTAAPTGSNQTGADENRRANDRHCAQRNDARRGSVSRNRRWSALPISTTSSATWRSMRRTFSDCRSARKRRGEPCLSRAISGDFGSGDDRSLRQCGGQSRDSAIGSAGPSTVTWSKSWSHSNPARC